MRISSENNINRQNYNVKNEKIQNNHKNETENHSVSYGKRSQAKNSVDEDNSFLEESEKIVQKAKKLITDFNIEKEDAEVMYRIAENIKRFSEYEYKSAKEVLDETGTLVKNERKKRTVNGITYRREKKKRFGGGIEIIDDANKQITRKIYKDRNELIITTFDKNNSCCIYSFNEKGELKSYIEGVKENEKGYSAKQRFTYSNGEIDSAEKDYEYFSSGDEIAKKHYAYYDKHLTDAYTSYKKINNDTQTITADRYLTYKKDFPYQLYNKFEATNDLNEVYKEKYTYEVNDYITYLKEYRTEEYVYKFELNKLVTVTKNNINNKNTDRKAKKSDIDEEVFE
ncbi:MAG: hypothetical protein IJY61_06590 [Candidatus Gastranaerophilales bacterium]|nr:hypothetical protein [Candidatus Gastranaerophilales bacterium]